MARPGLMRHRKFARLARLVGSEVLARGHLELLWEVAYENGDDQVGDAGDLEHLAKWTGAPGALASALVESGFFDLDGGTYRVHDLWDHAPDYVRKRRHREVERQTKGATLESVTGQCPPNGSQCPPNGRTRAPAPAPSQEATTYTQGSEVREAGSEARQAIESAHGAAPHPLTDAVVRALRSKAIEPAYPAARSCGPVEAAIREVGVEAAVERIYAAWDTSQPWLTFYLQTITGRAPTKKGKPAPTNVNAPAAIGTNWGGPAPF